MLKKLGTAALFVMLILTVFALNSIDAPAAPRISADAPVLVQ